MIGKEGTCKHRGANNVWLDKLRVLKSKIDATVFIVHRKACHHYQFQIKRHGRLIWIVYIAGSKLPRKASSSSKKEVSGPGLCFSSLFEDPRMQSVSTFFIFAHPCLFSGRRSCLMVSALVPGASVSGLSPGRGHCVVLLGKTFNSHSVSLHPGV